MIKSIKNGQRIEGHAHIYHFDGCYYPSVTTIIHRATPEPESLKRWKKTFKLTGFSSSEEYTRFSAIQGTFVHHAILNKLSPFPLDAGELPAFDEWVQWSGKITAAVKNAKKLWELADIQVHTPVHIETPLCHHGLWYAGQPDLYGLVEYNGEKKRTIIDLKTSKQPYDTHKQQIGAYSGMINYTHVPAEKIEFGLLVYLNAKMDTPLIVEIEKDQIKEQIEVFKETRDAFYKIPGVMQDYNIKVRY